MQAIQAEEHTMSAIQIKDTSFALDYVKNELITECTKHGVQVQFSRGTKYDRYAFAKGVVAKVDHYGITIEQDATSVCYFTGPVEHYYDALQTVEALLK
jgi:hypothetical protein